MNQRIRSTSLVLAAIISLSVVLPNIARATIVEVQTNVGNFQVNLYDNGTPQTVANFLAYVNNTDYSDSIIHRSAPGFVIQGGGFRYDPTLVTTDIPAVSILANAPVINEPNFANVRGTIAMAKFGNDPNSATNQWFINLADNTVNLDNQNDGFTVFGEVVSGMDVVDAIAALPMFPFNLPYDNIPLDNYSVTDFNNIVVVDDTHLIIVTAVVVIDETVDSAGAAGITPVPTTASNTTPPPVVQPSGGGGGTFGIPGLLLLVGLCLRRRIFRSS